MSTSTDEKNNKKNSQFIALVFLLIAGVLYQVLQVNQKAFVVKSSLYAKGRYTCINDKTIADLEADSDFTSDCVSFTADFKIDNDVCSEDILSESMCGKCIDMRQRVQQYQHRIKETRVCSRKGRNGDEVREEFDSSDESDAAKNARSNNNCHTEYEHVYEWKNNPANGQSWNFATTQTTANDPANLNFEDAGAKVRFNTGGDNNQYRNIIKRRTVHELGTVPMAVWNTTFYGNAGLDAARDPTELCMSEAEAANFDSDGLTDAEFQALTNFGDIAHYPSCDSDHPTMSVGSYKVSAECIGKPAASVRIIGMVSRINGTLMSSGYTDPDYTNPDDDAIADEFKPFIWIWTDASEDTDAAFARESQEMAVEFKNFENTMNGCMAICVIIAVVILYSSNKSGSSSSSS